MKFICFSSGAQRRYRDDIVRAMAMPPGCELTFRYRTKYLALAVRERLGSGTLVQGAEILICYLDQSERSKPVDFIPVRFALLREAPEIGDFVVLRMRVSDFAFSQDLDVFAREAHIQSADLPKWSTSEESKHAVGSFWAEIGEFPKSVVRSRSISQWQRTVGELLARKDFADIGPFYQVVALRELEKQNTVSMSEGEYGLRPATEYELLVDHYLPQQPAGNFQLEILPSGSALTWITGTTLQIDSPYDRHWLRFKTLEPMKSERALLSVRKKSPGEDSTVQFDLPMSIRGRLGKAVLSGVVIGVLLAAPQIIAACMNPSLAAKGLRLILGLAVVILIFNLVVGITAALNFRKPI